MSTTTIRALRQLTYASRRAAARPVMMLRSGQTLLATRYVPRTALSLSATRAFSTTPSHSSAGASDALFSQRLAEELKFVKENAQPGEPDFLKSFKADGVWTIEDVEGSNEVTFARTFGNESIRVMLSIGDMHGVRALAGLHAMEGRENAPCLIPMSFVITKDGAKGAFNVNAMSHEGMVSVGPAVYFPDGKLGTEPRVEAIWKRQGLYGPQFDMLNKSIQEGFEKWLYERGLNECLVAFIPQYAEYKEQKEYLRWLEITKNFVEA